MIDPKKVLNFHWVENGTKFELMLKMEQDFYVSKMFGKHSHMASWIDTNLKHLFNRTEKADYERYLKLKAKAGEVV